MKNIKVILFLTVICHLSANADDIRAGVSRSAPKYEVGLGKSDITGEAAQVGMLGYADIGQKTVGIKSRQWARAFIIKHIATKKYMVFVNTDLGMLFQSVHQEVLQKLSSLYKGKYTKDNVILSATHSHSGPGGFSHYGLYNITTLGYNKKTFNAIVDGIVESIQIADKDLKTGEISFASAPVTIDTITKNRSMGAYENNTVSDKEKFKSSEHVDKTMTVLKFSQSGKEVGMISWFATHPVSMSVKNEHITGDNKGFASNYVEKEKSNNGKNKYIAAFAQSNPGDVTPNLSLDGTHRTGDGDYAETRRVGKVQAETALDILKNKMTIVDGELSYRQQYVDMSKVTVRPEFGGGKTCTAALGIGFAVGTEDYRGPFFPLYKEGDLSFGNDDTIKKAKAELIEAFPTLTVGVATTMGLLAVSPTAAAAAASAGSIAIVASPIAIALFPSMLKSTIDCHSPKPVLVATGEYHDINSKSPLKFPLTPEVMSVSLIKIGQVAIVAAPAEFTTIAGAKIKDEVAKTLELKYENIIFAGYSNGYSGYVTTEKEYEKQHYEGGSTHFGKYTLAAYIQNYHDLADSLKNNTQIANGPKPRDLSNYQHTLQTGVVLDTAPLLKKFGDVTNDHKIQASYKAGEDLVKISFWSAHPKNNLKRNASYLRIEKYENNKWIKIADDDDWSTRYTWERSGVSDSKATILWNIPKDTESGKYRIKHFASHKNLLGKITDFDGVSDTFLVK